MHIKAYFGTRNLVLFLIPVKFIFLIRESGDDVEGIQSSLGGASHVYNLSLKGTGQPQILVLRIQYEYFTVLRGQVGQNTLGCIGFTRTGLSNHHHIAVDPLLVPGKKVQEYRTPCALSQADPFLFHHYLIHVWECRGHRAAVDSPPVLGKCVEGGYMAGSVGIKLPHKHI